VIGTQVKLDRIVYTLEGGGYAVQRVAGLGVRICTPQELSAFGLD
jgi:hypothetical protein